MANEGCVPIPVTLRSSSLMTFSCWLISSSCVTHLCCPSLPIYCRSSSQMGQHEGAEKPSNWAPQVQQTCTICNIYFKHMIKALLPYRHGHEGVSTSSCPPKGSQAFQPSFLCSQYNVALLLLQPQRFLMWWMANLRLHSLLAMNMFTAGYEYDIKHGFYARLVSS